MTDFVLNHADRLLWLPCAAIAPALYMLGSARRRRDVLAFLGATHVPASDRSRVRLARPVILGLSAASIIVALAGPVWNAHPKHPLRQGRDVVFVLDVSNSMLGADIPPSRLARAKSAIEDCVRTFNGQRVGLALFAGTAVIKCPLTLDYDFFSHVLAATGPTSVNQGGTRIQDALLLTCEKLLGDATQGYRDIILISDGGDQGESTAEATRMIDSMGVKLIAIGIGSSGTGARVPHPERPGEFVLYRGEEVWTKLEAESLRRLARSCVQGVYLPVGTSNMELGAIYRDLSRQPSQQQFAEETVTAYDQGFPFFIGLALLLLVSMPFIPAGARRAPAGRALHVAALLVLSGTFAQAGPLRDAQRAFRDGDFDRAAECYAAVVAEQPSADVWYNLGNARYRQKQFAEAIEAYRSALTPDASGTVRIRATYNMANAYGRLAETTTDQAGAVRLLDAAIERYRRVLRQAPEMEEAAVNLELALLAKRDAEDELARRRDAAMSYEKERDPADSGDEEISESSETSATGVFNTQAPDASGGEVLPPTESPEDILERQAELRERRNAGGTRPRKRVRTDW